MHPEQHPIKRLQSRLVFENSFVEVYDDDVEFSGAQVGRHVRIVQSRGRPGVAVLPVHDHQVALVKVFRYPTGQWEWAVPRGWAHGENPLVTAQRELVEEIGVEPAALIPLGVTTPDSGLLASEVHLVLARLPHMPTSPPRNEETVAIRWLSVVDIADEVRSGRIRDSFTLAILAAAALHGLISLR